MCIIIDSLTPENAFVNTADQRIDPDNPFRNPTQEPQYAPDYTAIVPQIAIPGCRLPLLPSRKEKTTIRRYYTLAGLLLFLQYTLAGAVANLVYMLGTLLLRFVDSHALDGSLPANYSSIAQSYLSDSSIEIGSNLLGFFLSNMVVFFIGCKVSKLKPMSFFRDRDLSVPTVLRYCLLGLFIQFAAAKAIDIAESLLGSHNPLLSSPDFSMGDSPTKLLLTVLYSCLIAPITEELVFRGVFLKNMSRVSQRFGIFMSAFFFALAHQNLPQGVLAFFLGILLGYITIKHNSLVPAIIVHFTVNVTSMVFTRLSEIAPVSADKVFMLVTLIIFVLGLIMLIYTATTEHLPEDTPFQKMRCGRVALGSWGLWLAGVLHIGMMTFPTLLAWLSDIFLEGWLYVSL